jgi:hypothetical protein
VSRTGKMARFSKSADFLIFSLIFRHPRTHEFGPSVHSRVRIVSKAYRPQAFYHLRLKGRLTSPRRL